MAKTKTVLIPTSVELTEDQVSALQEGIGSNADLTTEIRKYANAFLRTYIEGGLMLSRQHLEAIERATGTKLSLPEEVIQFALEAKGRKNGQYTVSAEVDEAFWPSVEETAAHSGLTPDELLQNLIQYVISEGWVYSWSPSGFTLHFTEADAQYLQDLVGKKAFTGKDLVSTLRGLLEKKAA